MKERNLFPVVAFDLIDDRSADRALEQWGHWLGGCKRPFGRQSWGLTVHGELTGVAVSASTVNATCGGYQRREVVELARLCAHPSHRDLTRVVLRLWRKVAPAAWGADYWIVRALVSYANAVRHRGDIYRFDGWTKVAVVNCSGGGGTWSRPRRAGERKTVWAFELGGGGQLPRDVPGPKGREELDGGSAPDDFPSDSRPERCRDSRRGERYGIGESEDP